MVSIPTDSLVEARNLALRFQKGAGFRGYVSERLQLVIPAGLVFTALVTAGAAATIAFLAGTYSFFVLPSFILAPFLLVGGYAVAAYLFFAWLEARALRHSLKHDLGADALPKIPWILAGVLLGIPLLVLVTFWWKLGLPLVALSVATPFAFARLDR
jgi:hypothetical protein